MNACPGHCLFWNRRKLVVFWDIAFKLMPLLWLNQGSANFLYVFRLASCSESRTEKNVCITMMLLLNPVTRLPIKVAALCWNVLAFFYFFFFPHKVWPCTFYPCCMSATNFHHLWDHFQLCWNVPVILMSRDKKIKNLAGIFLCKMNVQIVNRQYTDTSWVC